MITIYVIFLLWIVRGGIAWKIATGRDGSVALWAVVGQLLGPLSIQLAFLVKPELRS
jgi:hypothetical protein